MVKSDPCFERLWNRLGTKLYQGQEAEAKKRIKAFEGFQITNALAERGAAKPGWKFMHCLPRHPEE